MACSVEHTGVINPSKSRIKVFSFETEGARFPTPVPNAEAWCLNACPVDDPPRRGDRRQAGLRRRLRGLQGVHHRLPVRHRQLQPGHRQGPEVRPVRRRPGLRHACPTGAITYIDADWTGLDRMRAWAAKANTAVTE
jgi:Fe-S-cluster-containing hydrogenase component 2